MIEPLLSGKYRRLALALLPLLAAPMLLADPPAVAASTTESADGVSYVLIAAGNGSSTMSGAVDDIRRAGALRRGREALLYVRQAGAAYVIRDAETLRRAEAIFAPQSRLGDQQGELGDRQGELGDRQGELGEQQARLGARQANASPSRAEELSRQQEALGRQQEELGRQQEALGREQEALGREQERLTREAEGQLRELLDAALRSGVAQRVD